MSEADELEVFILTVDAVRNVNFDDAIYFPRILYGIGYGKVIDEMLSDVNGQLRTKAKKVGANAVLGVSYSKPEYAERQWWTMATGTPAYIDDIEEVFKQFKDNRGEQA